VIRQPLNLETRFDSNWVANVDKTAKDLKTKVDINGSKHGILLHLVDDINAVLPVSVFCTIDTSFEFSFL